MIVTKVFKNRKLASETLSEDFLLFYKVNKFNTRKIEKVIALLVIDALLCRHVNFANNIDYKVKYLSTETKLSIFNLMEELNAIVSDKNRLK